MKNYQIIESSKSSGYLRLETIKARNKKEAVRLYAEKYTVRQMEKPSEALIRNWYKNSYEVVEKLYAETNSTFTKRSEIIF